VAATVRLLHRRHGWVRAAVTCFLLFLLAFGGYSSAQEQGTPPPFWFLVVVIVLGAMTVVGIVAAVADTALLRRWPPSIRAQAVPLAAAHPSRPHAHHYPPRHWVAWAVRWTGMLLILIVAVASVPAVVDGVAYLACAEKMATFHPVAYETTCEVQSGCETGTEGILETGGKGVEATWPHVVPLGKPFQVRRPAWRWGLGDALIDSHTIAVVAVFLSLLIEAAAVLVIISLVRLARNWRRHRRPRQRAAQL